MEEILEKGKRLRLPKSVSVSLRPEVYDWLSEVAVSCRKSVNYVIRSLVEDAYDQVDHPDPDQEVPGDE